ncbi:MAG: alanine racemase [Micropepsaceae bacterium]
MNLTQIQANIGHMQDNSAPISGARLSVDLAALGANYGEVVRRSSPAAVAPVVKADAYGLGMAPIAQKLAVMGAESFFVARMEEGIALRPIVPNTRIFVFHGLTPGTASSYVAHGLIPVLNTAEEIAEYSAHARGSRNILDAAIQIDTGMNRSGLSSEDVSALAANPASALEGLNLVLIMSHLACADEPAHALNRKQLERFRASLEALPPTPASLAATAGIELGKEFLFEIVRPGIGLYGGDPITARSEADGSNPYSTVATLTANVLHTRHIEEGETVGYGATFRAAKPSVVAVVPLGYADGLIRAMGAAGHAAINGIRVPFAGRISMDLVALEITALDEDKCKSGTEVEFLGRTISLKEVAQAAGTIGHEVLTSLSPRVARVYAEG